MKLTVGHLAAGDEVLMQGSQLQAAEHVASLIERAIIPLEASPHFARCIFPLMADSLHEKVDALLRRHFAEVKAERENDPGAAMRAPKEHADAVFRRLGKIE